MNAPRAIVIMTVFVLSISVFCLETYGQTKKAEKNPIKTASTKKEVCTFCKGTGKVKVSKVCYNCASWSYEYRRKVPCHICKDTRFYGTEFIKCPNCDGTGKVDPESINKPKEKDYSSFTLEELDKEYDQCIKKLSAGDYKYFSDLEKITQAQFNKRMEAQTEPRHEGRRYYDVYEPAKPVVASAATTTAAATTAANVSANDVIAKYIKVIGGEEAIKKVNTTFTEMEMIVEGKTLNVAWKLMNPNKEIFECSMGRNIVSKNMFDGEKGYQMNKDNKKIDLTNYQVVEKIRQTNIINFNNFNQVNYKNARYKLEMKGVEKVNSKDAYKLIVTNPAGGTTNEFYDVNTGFLLKSESTRPAGLDDMKIGNDIKAGMYIITRSKEYDNYTKVNDVFVPFSTIITEGEAGENQLTILTKVKNMKVNVGVSEKDFK